MKKASMVVVLYTKMLTVLSPHYPQLLFFLL